MEAALPRAGSIGDLFQAPLSRKLFLLRLYSITQSGGGVAFFPLESFSLYSALILNGFSHLGARWERPFDKVETVMKETYD
jgi:hypothetical protein